MRTVRSPEKDRIFLETLANAQSVAASCRVAGYERRRVYEWRDKDEEFAKAWADAEEAGTDKLEDEAKRRAEEGVARIILHEGKPVIIGYTADGDPCLPEDKDCARTEILRESRHSDTLMIFLLKARRPEKYRERQDHTVSGHISVKRQLFGDDSS